MAKRNADTQTNNVKTDVPNLSGLLTEIAISRNIPMFNWVLFGIILVGIIIKTFTANLHIELSPEQKLTGVLPIGPATGSIWGYSIILFAILCIIFTSVNPQEENMEQLKQVPNSIYCIVILLIWSIILNFTHYAQINSSVMPKEYTRWDVWSIVVITILSIITLLEISINKYFPQYEPLKPNIKIFMIIVFVSGIITLSIQDTIINYFLVDG